MKLNQFSILLLTVYPLFSQTDTIYYDPLTGNYNVRYIGLTIDDRDTLISFVYEPSTKIDPNIRSFIKQTSDGNFLYRYRITNGSNAKQNLFEFSLHYDSTVWVESKTPESSWRNRGRKIQDYSDLNNPKLVSSWVWRGDQGLEATWAIDNCIILSNGLPSITNSYSKAVHHILVWPADQKDNSLIDISGKLFDLEIYPRNNVLSKTIGPVLPPDPFIPLTFLDTLIGYATQCRSLGWITNQPMADKYLNYFTTAKTQLLSNNTNGAWQTMQTVVTNTISDSISNLTSEAYALLRFNTEYLISQLPPPTSGLSVKLTNSTGTNLTNGALQYYEGSWKDATNNGDGTFSVSTTKPTISLRMTYEYGTEQKNNVTVGSTPVVFQTINTQVKLQNSQGNPMDTGTVRYYAGAWRTFGTTTSGTASKELLANNYSFRMTYAYGSNDKQQDLNSNSTVVFQTVNAAVQLKNSQGSFIDQGTVQYYSGAWRTFGTTSNGVATKELLPNNYSFRMTYAFGSNDRQQDLNTNSTVVFQTVNAEVQLKNSQGELIDQGTVQYYSGAWRDFGTTANGIANKELLPNNYSFRMTYAYASKDKQQDLNTNPIVVFQTVNAIVQLKNSQGNLIDQGTVQYYSGAWRTFSSTANGTTSKELLPNSYQFRMTHEYVSNDKTQDVGANNTVAFSTVSATVRVKNLQNNPVNGATVTYYSGAWRSIGTTPANGEVSKELLPANLQFRAKLGSTQQDKTQNTSTNPVVDIQLNINQ